MSKITRSRAIRAASTTALGLVVAAAASAPASAAVSATATVSGTTLTIKGAAGISSDLTVTKSSTTYIVVSNVAGATVKPGAGCLTPTSGGVPVPTKAYCKATIALISAPLGDGNDKFTASTLTTKVKADGGSGKDTIKTGFAADTLTGSTENDSLTGGDGDDTINGNDGDDSISGGAGADKLAGNLGNDKINAGAGIDTVDGDNPGDIFAGGNDTINVVDGGNDTTECSGGTDTVLADPLFPLLNDAYVGFGFTCETVTR